MDLDKSTENNHKHATNSKQNGTYGSSARMGTNHDHKSKKPHRILKANANHLDRRLSAPTSTHEIKSLRNTSELKNLLAFTKPRLFKTEKNVNNIVSALTPIPAPSQIPPLLDVVDRNVPTTELFDVLNVCDNLIDKDSVLQNRKAFMQKSIDSYEQATVLLGYFSQLQDFKMELAQLNHKLTNHRKMILETYMDILPQDTIKSLTMPSNKNKLYKKGINKFYKVKNYILYHYKQKLYTELESDHKQINNIREIVYTITRLDKHYDIYHELISELQKKNQVFDEIMRKHLTEFIYI